MVTPSTSSSLLDRPGTLSGLMAVKVDGHAKVVSCAYRPAGLRLGLATGFAALVGLFGLIGALELRRRKISGS